MAKRLDVWAELLLSARSVWNGVVAWFASMPPGDAPVAHEDAYLNAQYPDWGEHPAWQAGIAAAKLVDVASHYALGVRALIQDRQLVLAPGPLLRAEVEHLARACWILDPDVTPPERRIARLWLEFLHGAYRRRLTEKELGDKAEERRAKQNRELVRAEIERRFPGANTICGPPEEPIEWLVGGQEYPSLQKVCKRLEVIFGEEVGGIYDVLSHISHPNIQEIDAITYGDLKRTAFTYRVHGESVISQVGNAGVLLNLATSLVALYFGMDQGPIEEWHKRAVEAD